MSIKNNRIFKGIIIGLLILVVALGVECLLFNMHSIFNKSNPVSFNLSETSDAVTIENEEILAELSEDEIEAIELQKANDKILAELNGEEYVEKEDKTLVIKKGTYYRKVYRTNIALNIGKEYFIKKIKVEYPTETKLGFGITVFDNDKETESTYDTLDSQIDVFVTNLNAKGNRVQLTVSGNEILDTSKAVITLSNDFDFNWYRVFYLVAAMAVVAFIIFNRKLVKERIEIVFAILALVFGSFIIVYNGTNQLSWDEHIHYESAYRASFGSVVEFTESAYKAVGLVIPTAGSVEEKEIVADYLQTWNDFSKADLKGQQRLIEFNKRSYIPQSIAMAIARKLNMPFDIAYMMGKFGNLIFYVIMMAIAIRISKIGKMYIALIGLMPTPIFLACSYAYDAFISSLLILGFVMWLNEILDKDSKLKWYNALMMIGFFVVGSWSKPIYMTMMLLLVFLPKNKFDNRFMEIGFKLASTVLVGVMLYTMVSPPASTAANVYSIETDIAYFGDKRVADTSFLGQIEYILKNPLEYTVLLLRSLFKTSFDYILGTSTWLLYAYAGRFPAVFAVISALLFAGLSLVQLEEDRKYVLETKWKVLFGIMVFGVASVIWTGMYVTFTSVGADYINGVQGRYYIPLIMPFMLIFKNNVIKNKLSDELYKKMIFGVITFVNLYGTYVFFLKPFCF